MQKSPIQWTDYTTNPIRARRIDGSNRVPGHYCQKISAGCANCYASRMQPRFGLPQFPGTSLSASAMGVEVFLDESVLKKILRHRTPAKVFWCDMSDMFGAWVPVAFIDKCFTVMALTPHLTHQVLTKRTERLAAYLNDKSMPGRIYRVISDWLDGGKSGILGRGMGVGAPPGPTSIRAMNWRRP